MFIVARRIVLFAIRLCPLIICVFFLFPIHAQLNYLRFQHLTTHDGLLSNITGSLVQDYEGYLWIGTYNGLNRYDGYSFKSFISQPDDSNSLIQGPIVALCVDNDDNIWSASIYGICKYDRQSGRFYRTMTGPYWRSVLGQYSPIHLLKDKEGFIWLFNEPRHCYRINPKTLEYDTYTFGMGNMYFDLNSDGVIQSDSEVFDINRKVFVKADSKNVRLAGNSSVILCEYTDNRNCLWIGSNDGVYVYSGKNMVKRYLKGQNLNISAIFQDRKGIIWIGTSYSGIYTIDPGSNTGSHYEHERNDPNSISHNFILALCSDNAGNIWVGTRNGLDKLEFSSRKFMQYAFDPNGVYGLNASELRALHEDRKGNIWVGTCGGGLNEIDRNKGQQVFHSYLYQLPDPNLYGINYVNRICDDQDGRLLVGAENGLYTFDTNKKKFDQILLPGQEKREQNIPYAVWSIRQLNEHFALVGTQMEGLFLWNRRNNSFIRATVPGNSDSVYKGPIWCTLRDRYGNVWIGNHLGLYNAVFNADSSAIAIKPYLSGNATQLEGNNVWEIYEDDNDRLWLATSEGGLNVLGLKSHRFDHYTTKNGLPSNSICSVLQDGKNLWVGTLSGLCQFDPAVGKAIQAFTEEDGLQSNHLGYKMLLKSRTGEIFIGSQNGLNSFYPQMLRQVHFQPQMVITSFKVLYRDYASALNKSDGVSLKHDQNSFSIEFASLDLTNPAHNQFRYYLEGLENEWQYSGTRHIVNYTGVPPGKYIFHLQGTNSEGEWSSKELTFPVYIQTAYWQEWWFKLGVTLGAIGLVFYLVYTIISTQAEKRKRVEMELIALRSQLNPHFIFNSLSSLQHFITTHQDELALDYLSRFAVLIRMILNNTRYPYIPLSDEIDFLNLYTYLENIRFDKKIHFSVSWDKSLNTAKIKMPPMLVQPLIENAIKHGLLANRLDGKVEVHFFAKNDMLTCLVRDNGIGLSKAEANKKLSTIVHHSISTNVIRERLEKLGSEKHASLEIREEKDENGNILGTLAILSIPFSDKFIIKNPEE